MPTNNRPLISAAKAPQNSNHALLQPALGLPAIAPAAIPYMGFLPTNPLPPLSTIPNDASASRSYLHTPDVFRHRKFRSGKWIPEEEKYAELVIEEFEKGRITGCENGCTLRSYLSQKLHCAPMRISKKFAGKGIGKMVYVSKMNVAQTKEQEVAHQKLRDKVQRAQEKFYQAVFPQNESVGVGSVSTRLRLRSTMIQYSHDCCFVATLLLSRWVVS